MAPGQSTFYVAAASRAGELCRYVFKTCGDSRDDQARAAELVALLNAASKHCPDQNPLYPLMEQALAYVELAAQCGATFPNRHDALNLAHDIRNALQGEVARVELARMDREEARS